MMRDSWLLCTCYMGLRIFSVTEGRNRGVASRNAKITEIRSLVHPYCWIHAQQKFCTNWIDVNLMKTGLTNQLTSSVVIEAVTDSIWLLFPQKEIGEIRIFLICWNWIQNKSYIAETVFLFLLVNGISKILISYKQILGLICSMISSPHNSCSCPTSRRAGYPMDEIMKLTGRISLEILVRSYRIRTAAQSKRNLRNFRKLFIIFF